MKTRPIVLICTGLGHQNRGFEQYIASLAQKLEASGQFPYLEVWSGDTWPHGPVKSRVFPTLRRSSRLAKASGNAFIAEQASFLMAILPMLLYNPPAAIYLGEYRLYCWLFKMRRLLGLGYRLCLYTGGQAIPGNTVFDPGRDYLHHVTPVYLPECRHIPMHHQTVLPHFMEEDFGYDTVRRQAIRSRSGGKKMVLSVGMADRAVKRMDLLIAALAPLSREVFPVILGQFSPDTPALKIELERHFGPEGFVLATLPHAQLGDWYRAADLFVLCSPRESFGLAMVEALYHDLPVICRDFPEARFVMQEQATYLATDDTAEWTRAIKQAFHNQQKTGEAARFARSNYTWEALGPAYLSLFNDLSVKPAS